MEAKLIVVRGKANKGEVALSLPSTIGRSRDCDLTVAHPMVSRNHCEIFESDGKLMVRDLGSLNGTFVDGERVTEAEIPPKAEITVGPLTFRAEYQAPGAEDELPMFEDAADVAEVDFQDTAEVDESEDETAPVEKPKKVAAPSDDDLDFDAFADEIEEAEPADELDEEPEPEVKPDKKKTAPGKKPAKAKKEEPAEVDDVGDTASFSLEDLEEEHESSDQETIRAEAPAEETEEAEEADEEDEEDEDSAPAAKGKGGKEKKGWWPFKDKKDKGSPKKEEAAKKESPKKEPPKKEPAKREPAPVAKKEPKPAAPAKKAAAKSAAPDLDDLALAAVQGDEDDAGGAPAENEDEDLDNFLDNLQ